MKHIVVSSSLCGEKNTFNHRGHGVALKIRLIKSSSARADTQPFHCLTAIR